MVTLCILQEYCPLLLIAGGQNRPKLSLACQKEGCIETVTSFYRDSHVPAKSSINVDFETDFEAFIG